MKTLWVLLLFPAMAFAQGNNNFPNGSGGSGGGGDAVTSPNSTIVVGGTTAATTLDVAGSAGQIVENQALTYAPTFGAVGHQGSMLLVGTTSGTVTQTTQGAAGTPTVTWGTNSGTPVVTASAPMGVNTTTGNVACSTCATQGGGGAIKRTLGWGFGDAVTGAALTTSEVGYITVPFACTISGWHIMLDAGTATLKTWRVNGGTALPTVANSINTSGVAISTGTKVDSSTVSDFTSTAIAVNDTLGFSLSAVATAKQLTFQLDCTQ